MRVGKYRLFEAGTRVRFITYWKRKIGPSVSGALVCQGDLLTSLAALVGSNREGEDSEDLLDALMGRSDHGRDELVLEASSKTAFRKGDWVMIPPYKGPAINISVNIELGNDEGFQLYDLKNDLGQRTNLALANPEKLKEMVLAYVAIKGDENKLLEALDQKE